MDHAEWLGRSQHTPAAINSRAAARDHVETCPLPVRIIRAADQILMTLFGGWIFPIAQKRLRLLPSRPRRTESDRGIRADGELFLLPVKAIC